MAAVVCEGPGRVCRVRVWARQAARRCDGVAVGAALRPGAAATRAGGQLGAGVPTGAATPVVLPLQVCLCMAYAYMLRLGASDPALRPSVFSIHRVLITGLMVAAKFIDDR